MTAASVEGIKTCVIMCTTPFSASMSVNVKCANVFSKASPEAENDRRLIHASVQKIDTCISTED